MLMAVLKLIKKVIKLISNDSGIGAAKLNESILIVKRNILDCNKNQGEFYSLKNCFYMRYILVVNPIMHFY